MAAADGPIYGELQLAGGAVRHSDIDFYPTFGSATIGGYVLPNIGIELFADMGFGSDSSRGLNMDIEGAYGIAARFQSARATRGIRGYIVLGAVSYTLDQDIRASGSSAARSVEEDFVGFRGSVGLMQRLKRFNNLQFTAEYRHYNADEPLRVDALVLGLRVNTP